MICSYIGKVNINHIHNKNIIANRSKISQHWIPPQVINFLHHPYELSSPKFEGLRLFTPCFSLELPLETIFFTIRNVITPSQLIFYLILCNKAPSTFSRAITSFMYKTVSLMCLQSLQNDDNNLIAYYSSSNLHQYFANA